MISTEFFRAQLDAQGVLPPQVREAYLEYITERWDVPQSVQRLIREDGAWFSDNMLYRNSRAGETSASRWLLLGISWEREQTAQGLQSDYYSTQWRRACSAERAEAARAVEEEEEISEAAIAEAERVEAELDSAVSEVAIAGAELLISELLGGAERPEAEPTNWRGELSSYHAITEWEPLGDGTLFFGVELEVNNREQRRLSDLRLPGCLAGAEVDGSLDPDLGLEFIFQPQSWGYLREGELLRFASYLHEKGFRRGHAEYGLHVHLTRSAFYNDAHIKRFYDFFMELTPLQRLEVGRRSDNGYCDKCTTFKEDGYPSTSYKARWESRYGRVNLCNYETVEVRLFRSTLDPEHLAESLAWCKAVFQESRKRRPTFEACLERAQKLVAELLG